jgi:penicillin-binding protein 1A
MTVMDQATGYSVFAQNGFVGSRHGITQLVTHTGTVVYDFAKDAPPPHRVLSEQALKSMNTMLAAVPVMGTARRAQIPNIVVAGKTGTTQSYRDAWFVGFTGNYTAAVWLGNDDFSPTKNMTGGSLPAMVWHRLMTYAHENVDLKPIPGIDNPFVDAAVIAKLEEKQKKQKKTDEEADFNQIERRPVLSGSTTRALRAIAEIFKNSPIIDAPPEPETLSAL